MEREEAAYDFEAHWLDSDTIDGCCQTVVDMCTSDETIGTNSVLFVSSLAVSAALSRLDSAKVTQETVRRGLGIVEKKKMWPPRDLACFSINNGAHWSLLAYFPGYNKHRIYHYDSGRHFHGRGNASYAIKVVQMLARVRLVPATIQLINEIEFPIQEGGVECGYYLVATMANLLHCRRENLNQGRVICPINAYNLDLLHRYDLTKLQEIVSTLLFKRNEPSPDYNHHHHHHHYKNKNNKRKRPKKKSKSFHHQQQQQQQTIFSHHRRDISAAPFSFDDILDDDDDAASTPQPPPPTSKRKRTKQ